MPGDDGDPQLPPELEAAVAEYSVWERAYTLNELEASTVKNTLYHYTDLQGLKGILEHGKFWFTDYRHLNDPSELPHGIDMAHHVAQQIYTGADGRVEIFLKCLVDMLRLENFEAALEFYISCFSCDRDDLGQWRSYADNGRGFALGLSPSVFASTPRQSQQLPEFVGPVRYDLQEVCARHAACLEEAASVFLKAADANRQIMSDKDVGWPFIQKLSRAVMASPLIWNCLTTKHPAYVNEKEVRMVIMGMPHRLAPHVLTRFRKSEIVPYIAQPLPVREPNKIAEIVVGPAAPPDIERTLKTMLRTIGIRGDFPISRSDIPYRPA